MAPPKRNGRFAPNPERLSSNRRRGRGAVADARGSDAGPLSGWRPTPAGRSFAWEPIGWIVVLAIAIGLRLINLDGNPLQSSEAGLAMDSWRILHLGQTNQTFGTAFVVGPAPLLIYANVLLFFLLGSTDAVARGLPMLVGCLIVASPFLLRHRIGRFGALAAAALLATSPTLIFASRSVDPTILAVGLGVGIALAFAQYLAEPKQGWLVAAGVGGALLLISGPAAYPIVLALASFGVIYAREKATRGARSPAGSLGFFAQAAPLFPSSPSLDALGPRDLRAVLVAGAATLGVVATGLATHLPGLGESLSGPLTVWGEALARFDISSLWLFPAILVSYEPLILAAGIVGVVLAIRTGRLFETFLVWWAGASLLIVVLSGADNPIWVATGIPPLALLAGAALERLPSAIEARERRRALVPFATVTFVFGVTTLIALGNTTLPEPNVPLAVALAPPLAILAFVLYFGASYGVPTTGAMIATVGTVGLLYLQLHAALLLNPGRALNPGELFVTTATSPDVRTLASDVALIQDELTIDQQNAGMPVTTNVQILAPYSDPLVWYLHRLPDTKVVNSIDGTPAIAIVGDSAKALSGGYAAETFQFTKSASPPAVSYTGIVRWWLYHEPPEVKTTSVKVYVKTQVGQVP